MTCNILFLCTGNSARSILSEAYLNHRGGTRFRGFSAGSMPTGRVNPFALRVLSAHGIHSKEPSSKSWNVFAGPSAPVMDATITVCDNAAGEVCPIWPGHPAAAHWGMPDPAAATGTDAEITKAFEAVFGTVRRLIDEIVALKDEDLAKERLPATLRAIGHKILGEA